MHKYRKLLVPTDFSPQCSIAAQRAKTLAELFGGNITLFHVIDYMPPNHVAVELPAEYASMDFFIKKANKRMDDWAAENGLGDCEKIVATGQPKKIIVKQAETMHADVIVVSPNMESKFVRLFGSVTNSVAQSSNCDVLVVRKAHS